MYLELNIVIFQLAMSVCWRLIYLYHLSIYSWAFSRSHSKIRTSSQELKSDSNPFQIFSHVFGVYIDPYLEKLSLFSEKKKKTYSKRWFFLVFSLYVKKPPSGVQWAPLATTHWWRVPWPQGLGPNKNVSHSCIYPLSSGNRGSRGILLVHWQILQFQTWRPGWLVGRYCFFFWWEREF